MIIISLVALFGVDATAGLIKEFMCTILTLPINNFSLQTWKSQNTALY
jgi:hypothetical protein